MTGFDRELAIERAEAGVAAALEAHGAAVIAAARTGAAWPPWPEAVRALPRLTAPHDRSWDARARTLTRWGWAARLGAEVGVRAAHAQPASLDGLAARHRAVIAAAARLGATSAHALVASIHGPAAPVIAPAATDDGPTPALPAIELPDWRDVAAHLAHHAGVDARAIEVHADGVAAVTVATGAGATCVFPAVHDLTSLTVAAHELGHGVYAACWRGLPLGLAAAPSRAVDEAVAAWAVRALEELLPPAWAAVARWRRQRGERARARLAAMEHEALTTGDTAAAWRAHVGPWRPGLAAALLAEPGVAGAYAAADALVLTPARGAIAAWGAAGAALDLAALEGAAAPGANPAPLA